VNEKKSPKDKKLWESAYSVMNHPRTGPYLHGAAMVERISGVRHFWLVRGPCTQSVVQELQKQLSKTYNVGLTRPAPQNPHLGPKVPIA
jgi:hypothetical protein